MAQKNVCADPKNVSQRVRPDDLRFIQGVPPVKNRIHSDEKNSLCFAVEVVVNATRKLASK